MKTLKEECYDCDQCGKIEIGACLTGGWWSYPYGWFLMDGNEYSLLVCSIECAEKHDSSCPCVEPRPLPHGVRSKLHMNALYGEFGKVK